jgi:hypothetical protein
MGAWVGRERAVVEQDVPWSEAWIRPGVRPRVTATLAALAIALAGQARFYNWNEARSGVVLPDPLLELFAPVDVSWLTFGLIYAALATAVVVLWRRPRRLLQAAQAYSILAAFRVTLMALAPLDPPRSIIPLRDPLVELAGDGTTLTRDLFFSGHVATLTVLFLALPRGRARGFALLAAAAVAVLTVWQHTHYTVDVLVAPFLAYGCFRLAPRLFGDPLAPPTAPTP